MITREYISGVIEKLEAWREHDFHADRQLSDEVLIADGWRCEPDAGFEGRVRWFWGTNPQYSSSESTRPHVIHDLNGALAVVPKNHGVRLLINGGIATASVWAAGEIRRREHEGASTLATIAILIAALKANHHLMRTA
jgi:hypothetical protein